MSLSILPELAIGQPQWFHKVITEGESALFAGLAGDNHPQVSNSRANGTPQRIPVHELLIIGIMGGLLKSSAGTKSQFVNVKYEFLDPIYCGDRIEMGIELIEFDPVKRLATYKTDCYDQEKNQVITGQVVMLLQAGDA